MNAILKKCLCIAGLGLFVNLVDIADIEAAPVSELENLSSDAVSVYNLGSDEFVLNDILPIMSTSSGYDEKWELYLFGDEYQVRLKFEISNFAFSKNEGKLKGFVKKLNGKEVVEEYIISESLKNGQWSAAKDRLFLDFDKYKLSFDGKEFHLSGVYEKGSFEYDIPANLWKPGTGNVYFGNSEDNVFKYGLLTFHKEARGTIVKDGETIHTTALAYGNHYATTVAVYDMFDELADFREHNKDLLVEFRYFEPSQKYKRDPFGYMIVAYKGVPVLSSISMERTALETWLDDGNYGYEVNARQSIVGKEDNNQAVFNVLTASPKTSDPYADLPAFQRNIASRFAKPIEYAIPMDWELLVDVDGMKAKILMNGLYTITKMR